MTLVLAAVGIKALWLLYIWLLSAIACQWLSGQKGYGEKAGPRHRAAAEHRGRADLAAHARRSRNSRWAARRGRLRAAGGDDA